MSEEIIGARAAPKSPVEVSKTVKDVLEHVPFRVTRRMRMLELRSYLRRYGSPVVPIFKSLFDEHIEGFVTVADAALVTSKKDERAVGEFARAHPIIRGDETIEKAYRTLKEAGLPGAPVVDEEGKLMGIVTIHGMIRSLMVAGVGPRATSVNAVYSRLDEGTVMAVKPSTKVSKVWHRIVGGDSVGAIVVDHNGEAMGIITVWDFIKTSKWFFGTVGGPRAIFGRAIARGESSRVSVMRVRNLMSRGVPVATPDTPIVEVARFIASTGIDLVPVVDRDGKVIGAVTVWDVAMAWFEGAKEGREDIRVLVPEKIEEVEGGIVRKPVEEVVRARPVVHVTGIRARELVAADIPPVHVHDPISRIRKVLLRNGASHVAVINDEGEVVGYISRRDLLYYVAERRDYWKVQKGRRLVLRERTLKGETSRILVDEGTAGDIMRTEYPEVGEDATVEEMAYHMVVNGTDFVVVRSRDGGLLGLVTRDKLVEAFARRGRAATVGELMVPRDIATVNPLHSLTHVVRKMRSYGLDAVAVVDGGRVVGMVHEDSLSLKPIEETLRGEKLVVITLVRKITPAGPRRARHVRIGTLTAGDIADPPPTQLRPDADAREAARMLLELGASALPVVDDEGRPVGVFSRMEMVKDLARAYITATAKAPVKAPEAEKEEAIERT